MAVLITLQGPEMGRRFPLKDDRTMLGRLYESDICLSGQQVSRHHAHVTRRNGQYYIEDLGSSNGTFLNGQRLEANQPVPLTERDTLQIGPYMFALRPAVVPATPTPVEPPMIVRETVSASFSSDLYGQDPAAKLQVVLEIAQTLGRTLDLEPLLDQLLAHLLRLFPQADRTLVILSEGDRLVVRGQKSRGATEASLLPYSRTIVHRALNEGVGLWSEDVQSDERFQASMTLTTLGVHSMLCVPLITPEGKRLGAVQVDRHRQGQGFKVDDLKLLTAVGLQVAVVLENAALHAQRLQEQRLHQELALARDIQLGFLPTEYPKNSEDTVEILGRLFPARQVAGDLYDYFRLPDGKLAFFIGDVSGKGMPAALFMVMTRTLIRHLAKEPGSPVAILTRLNEALADDNPTCMFVTLCHGVIDSVRGDVTLVTAGHPPPVLRKANGAIEDVPLRPGRLLGVHLGDLHLSEHRLTLAPGELLAFYTDGLTEARPSGSKEMFGLSRLHDVLGRVAADAPLGQTSEQIKKAALDFSGGQELHDDLTLLLLRRAETTAQSP